MTHFACLVPLLLSLLGAPGDEQVAQGDAALKRAEFDTALTAYREAARLAPKRQEIVERAAILGRVVRLRRFVATKEPGPKWIGAVITLHAFYLDEGLAKHALELDRKAYEFRKEATTAARLAETHLALGQNDEAYRVLAVQRAPNDHCRALHLIALARLGRFEKARDIDGRFTLPKEATPGLLVLAARYKTLLGERERALGLLRASFENTPPAGLAAAKRRVKAQADFAALRALPGYEPALATASKLKETCSGGSDCGTCPSRSKCDEG